MSEGCLRLRDTDHVNGGIFTINPECPETVFVNTYPIAVDGALGRSHPPCPNPTIHCENNWELIARCKNVYAYGILVGINSNYATCGHVSSPGSENVFIGEE